MVTPAMQQQPPTVIYGPNGERAEWNGREYIEVRQAAPQAGPQMGGIPGLIQMETPAQRAQAEERVYDRQRDAVRDERLDRTESRAVEANARAAAAAERQSEALTEGQSKAVLFGRMMRGAEGDYQQARQNGYDPTNFRNAAANVLDGIPWDGGMIPAWVRDDASDAGYQAERRWVEANLRQLTGAAAPDTEVTRVQGINFDRANDSLADQRYRTRQDAYGATRASLGHARDLLPAEYPSAEGIRPPTVNDGRTVQQADDALAVAPGEYAADYVARFDRDGDNRASVEEMEAAGWSFDHGAGKWFPPGGGAGSPPAGPQGGPPPQGSQGGAPQSEGYQTALEQERAASDVMSKAGVNYDITNALTGPLNDEISYGAGYLAQGLSNIGRRLTGRDIEVSAAERGRAASDVMTEDRDQFAREHPVQNALGNVLGGAAFGPGGAARSMLGRMAQGSGVGATYGFAGAEGSVADRLPETAVGAGIGAVAVPVVEKAIAPAVNALARPVVQGAQSAGRFMGRQAGNVGNALGVPGSQRLVAANQPNPLASGMDMFARRSPQQPAEMGRNALAMRDQEIAPTFVDVINDGGRGTLRALATRQTPARQAAREFADGRAAGLQDRVSTQARRTISDDPRAPAEIRTEVAARRTQEADQAFGAVRGDVIAPEREVIEALRAPALKPAIEEAATAALNRGDSETANMLRQLSDGALDNPNGVQITVGMADRLARSLNGRAETFQRSGNNDAASSYFALAERLRGSARQQVPGYDSALNAYAADSRLLSATELGEQFMSMEADQFAAAVAKLSPDEQQIARAAARRAVERQAGTQGGAPGVAQRLSNGREQGARTQALTGDAAPVQQAMGAELQALRNAQGISPAQGSPTSMNAQDAMNAAGAVRDVATLNAPGLATRAITAIRSRGFSNQEAEAIVTAAIDPAQTDQLVSMLAERMTRREARNLARAIRYQLTTSLPTNQ